MASNYLDLYGNYTVRKPTRGGRTWTSPVDQASRVVHDRLNNVYYGIHSQSATAYYLTRAIAQSQQIANSTHGTRRVRGYGRGSREERYAYSAAERQQHQRTLANQNSYLNHINNGGYKQEANTFFDSYDAHTQGWNNLFTKRYNNEQIRLKNERIAAQNVITKANNIRTRARNLKIGKANVRNDKISKMNNALENQQDTKPSLTYALPVDNKLEIGTGLASETTKNRKNANAVLKDNGLNI